MSAAMSAGTTNVLRELKTSSFGAGLVQMDATTLDIVSMLFDQLFDDPKIPAGLKGLIGRLQIPLLKVAIADKSFFARKTHPARQMLDTLGDIAVRLPTEFSADSSTFVHLEVIVQHLIDNFQEDVAVFDGARERLLGVIAEHDKQIEAETKALAERIEQTENLSVAKTAAEDGPAKAAPAASLDFPAPVTIKTPSGGGQVQVPGLVFPPQPVAPKQRAAAKASLKSSLGVAPPADMEMGTWVEFRPKGDGEEHRAAKLLFVSPKKTRYLFSDRRGQNVLELSRAEIVRRLRSGEAVRLADAPEEPLFDRLMTSLVVQLQAP